jgi:hypothetical protein
MEIWVIMDPPAAHLSCCLRSKDPSRRRWRVFKARLAERESLQNRPAGDERERFELALLAETAASRAKGARELLIGSVSLAALAIFAVLGLELFVHRPELARIAQASRDALAAEAARISEVRALLADSERRRRELIDELERRTREQSVAPTLPHTRPTSSTPARPSRPTPGAAVSKPCVGDPHDPLNPCLGG